MITSLTDFREHKIHQVRSSLLGGRNVLTDTISKNPHSVAILCCDEDFERIHQNTISSEFASLVTVALIITTVRLYAL
jgi:hypothetical protein